VKDFSFKLCISEQNFSDKNNFRQLSYSPKFIVIAVFTFLAATPLVAIQHSKTLLEMKKAHVLSHNHRDQHKQAILVD